MYKTDFFGQCIKSEVLKSSGIQGQSEYLKSDLRTNIKPRCQQFIKVKVLMLMQLSRQLSNTVF